MLWRGRRGTLCRCGALLALGPAPRRAAPGGGAWGGEGAAARSGRGSRGSRVKGLLGAGPRGERSEVGAATLCKSALCLFLGLLFFLWGFFFFSSSG